MSEEEILDSLGLKNVARTANGKIDHAKLSMKDRMAIVRGMRKRRKKGSNGILKKRSPSPELAGENPDPDEPIHEYKAHISDIEKFEANPPYVELKDNSELEARRPEIFLDTCDKPAFLTNLNLFKPNEVQTIMDILDQDARVSLIHSYTEKDYYFLSNLHISLHKLKPRLAIVILESTFQPTKICSEIVNNGIFHF